MFFGQNVTVVTVPIAAVNNGNTVRGASPTTAAYGTAPGAGHLLVACIGIPNITATISTVTDSKGNAWQKATSLTGGIIGGIEIWYAMNSAAGATTLTVTSTVPGVQLAISLGEYSGIKLTSALDQAASQSTVSGTGTDGATSGNVTTTFGHDLILGFSANNTAAATVGTGFTLRQSFSFDLAQVTEDKVVFSTGSYAGTFTVATGFPLAAVATFKGQ